MGDLDGGGALPPPGDDLAAWLPRLRGRRVAVAGDFYVDEYVHARPIGMSPEKPVLRALEERVERAPGAAGNVLLNLAGLGAATVAVGCVGADDAGDFLHREFAARGADLGAFLRLPERRTGCFARILLAPGGGQEPQHLVRLDREPAGPPAPAALDRCLAAATAAFRGCHALLLADYDETADGRGLLAPAFAARLIASAHAAGLAVWGMSRSRLAAYPGLDGCVTNRAEAVTLVGSGAEAAAPDAAAATADLARLAVRVRARLGSADVCVTAGDRGAWLAAADADAEGEAPGAGPVRAPVADRCLHLPPRPARVVDPCGAGDAFAAALLLTRLAGAPWRTAGALAAAAAAQVVGKPGTAPVVAADLAPSLASDPE
ncbi:MAG: hypothetical protein HZA54_05355, partial [Planctomycetes bacterium]|nr:hypothetical protein [Planctomycetota bacterium]